MNWLNALAWSNQPYLKSWPVDLNFHGLVPLKRYPKVSEWRYRSFSTIRCLKIKSVPKQEKILVLLIQENIKRAEKWFSALLVCYKLVLTYLYFSKSNLIFAICAININIRNHSIIIRLPMKNVRVINFSKLLSGSFKLSPS